jgi:hypothetical protein
MNDGGISQLCHIIALLPILIWSTLPEMMTKKEFYILQLFTTNVYMFKFFATLPAIKLLMSYSI